MGLTLSGGLSLELVCLVGRLHVGGPIVAVAAPLAKVEGCNRALGEQPDHYKDNSERELQPDAEGRVVRSRRFKASGGQRT